MRRIIFSLLALTFMFVSFNAARAAAADAHGASIDELLSAIMSEQQVDSIRDVSCGGISEDTLEELGEGVMSLMHPNEQTHEYMDTMMGGEGSESLRWAHINMAQSYLGCGLGGYGMMGGMGMMNGNYSTLLNKSSVTADERGGFSMMEFPTIGAGFGSGWMIFGWLVMLVFWTLVIAGIVWLVKFLSGSGTTTGRQSALEILQARYAKGEINKTEFEKMKKDIR